MIKVTLLGQGNVSFHLAKAFQRSKHAKLVAVFDSRKKLPKSLLRQTEVFIIAVSDKAIGEVSQRFKGDSQLLVHTSGSVALTQLPEGARRGVFYPLQTFSKNKEVDFTDVPICIEAENENDMELLFKLASSISENVQKVSSAQRKSLHMAAIFANNFSNHMYRIAQEICEENNLDFDILRPLINETANKINTLAPHEAQTGPARRGDDAIIKTHQEL